MYYKAPRATSSLKLLKAIPLTRTVHSNSFKTFQNNDLDYYQYIKSDLKEKYIMNKLHPPGEQNDKKIT